MKKSYLTTIIITIFIFCSCSNETTETNPVEPNSIISELTYSRYSPNTSEVFEYTNFILENNKIVNSTYFSNSFNTDDITTNDTYTYVNDKISEITTYDNNEIIRKIS